MVVAPPQPIRHWVWASGGAMMRICDDATLNGQRVRWKAFLAGTTSLCLLASVILLAAAHSAAPAAAAEATPSPPILPGICSESDRFGLATTGVQVLKNLVEQLHAGWYVNFTVLAGAPRPADMSFVQTIRLSDDDGDSSRACLDCPTWNELLYAVQASPGAIWLVGNEPDSQTVQQDWVMPCRYAQLYKEIYDYIKGIDESSLVGVGGIVQPTPIRLGYLDLILAEYQAQFGMSMPIDVWNTHNYVLREKRYYGGQETPPLAPDGSEGVCAPSALAVSPAMATVSPLMINEMDADTPGTDAQEFVELYDGGTGNTALDGLVVVFFDGSNDRSYFTADLDTHHTNAGGYFVLGNAGVTGVDLVFANNLLQDGPDAVALYVGDASDFPANSPATTENLLDAIVYDTGDADDPGLLPLLNSCQPQVDESRRGTPADDSNQRCPNGTGAQRSTGTLAPALPTPNGENCQDECYGCWGAGVPPGIDVDAGILYEIDDHLMLDRHPTDPSRIGWKQQVIDLREFMAERGYRDRPLIVSEYGNLMPAEYGFSWDVVGDFLVDTANWFLSTTDPGFGYPADGNRLVQAWAWWPFDFTAFGGMPGEAHLFDPHSHALTPVGLRYSAYTRDLTEPYPGTVDLQLLSVLDSVAVPAPGGFVVTVTAEIVNQGALESGSFQVLFTIDGIDEPRIVEGSLLPGEVTSIHISKDVHLGQLLQVSVSADPDNLVVECDPYNNQLTTELWVGDYAVFFPLASRTSDP